MQLPKEIADLPLAAKIAGVAAAAAIALAIVKGLLGRVRRAARRGKPAQLHPKLQKYAGESPEVIAERQERARKVMTTSSTDRLVGFQVVRQVETLFVEGFRGPEEAILALKAAAALKGANAIINLRQERTAAGRCSATGDAVIARALDEPPAPTEEPPSR